MNVTDLGHGLRTILRNFRANPEITISLVAIVLIIVLFFSFMGWRKRVRQANAYGGAPVLPLLNIYSLLNILIWICGIFLLIYFASFYVFYGIIIASVVVRSAMETKEKKLQNEWLARNTGGSTYTQDIPRDPF